jgi:membrane protease subunit HflK
VHRAYHPSSRPHTHKRPIRWWRLLPWLLAAYLATGVYSVKPNERVVVRRCGKALPKLQPPGLHVGLPYGIDRISRVRVLEKKRVSIGSSQSERLIGRRALPQESEHLTGDTNLIVVSATVQYEVDGQNVDRYLFHVADVPSLVRNVASARLSEIISSMEVDDVLTVGRHEIQKWVKERAQEDLDSYGVLEPDGSDGSGIAITSVLLNEDLQPPQEVADAFLDVIAAREDRHRAINEARGYANRLKEQADADADSLTQQAQGYAGEITLMATGDASRFTQRAEHLDDNRRSLTVKRLIIETMEEVLPRVKKIVLDKSSAESVELGIIEAE